MLKYIHAVLICVLSKHCCNCVSEEPSHLCILCSCEAITTVLTRRYAIHVMFKQFFFFTYSSFKLVGDCHFCSEKSQCECETLPGLNTISLQLFGSRQRSPAPTLQFYTAVLAKCSISRTLVSSSYPKA